MVAVLNLNLTFGVVAVTNEATEMAMLKFGTETEHIHAQKLCTKYWFKPTIKNMVMVKIFHVMSDKLSREQLSIFKVVPRFTVFNVFVKYICKS
jgi:hypothetical protein